MPNIANLIDAISQEKTGNETAGRAWFSTIDLKYAYKQIPLHLDAAKHCKINLVIGEATRTYKFLTGSYGLTDMPAEFQKRLESTLVVVTNTPCFLDDSFCFEKFTIRTFRISSQMSG